jgi:hypothetical protein
LYSFQRRKTQVFPGKQALAAENRFPPVIGKKWSSMNISISKGLLLSLAVLLATTAFASNKGSMQISTSVVVNGKQLAPGDYSVKWEGNGPDVQVSIMKGKNVVAQAPAHVVTLNSSTADDAAVVQKNNDGSSSLAQIRFGGKKYALTLDEGSTAGAERGAN